VRGFGFPSKFDMLIEIKPDRRWSMGYYDPAELKAHHKVAIWLRLQGYSHE